MKIYRVFAPSDGGDPGAAAERVRFVRDGFSFWAMWLGPLWLLAQGLWLALLVWCVGAAAVGYAISSGYLSEGSWFWLYVLSALYLGFEGRGLIAAAAERGKYRFVDVASGADQIAAERAFFERWPREEPRPPLAPRPNIPPAPAGVIGMFPDAGA